MDRNLPFGVVCLPNEENIFQIQHCTDVQCVCHLHNEAEFIAVTHGSVKILQSKCDIVLNAGEALYIKPLEIHGFRTDDASVCSILIFPTDLVPEFAAAQVDSHPFKLSDTLCKQLCELNAEKRYDTLHTRAVLYPLCCEIVSHCAHTPGEYTDISALSRVERYISENIHTPLTLRSVAAATGFNHSYLSRMFHRNKGVGFLEYVNMLRCYQAVRLLYSPAELSVSEVAYQVGYESIRTFNRVFLQIYGITPSQMKQRKTASIPRG